MQYAYVHDKTTRSKRPYCVFEYDGTRKQARLVQMT